MSQEDRAQLDEVFHWERINAARAPTIVYSPEDPGYGPEFCKNDECEDPMPESRRRDGKTLCTTCTSMKEVREKRRY